MAGLDSDPLDRSEQSLSSELNLVRAARRGDEEAFAALVRSHQDRVFRLCARFYSRREDVEEAAQETFLTVWRKLAKYSAKAPFEHWLTRVCLNTCYQRLRKKSVAVETLEQDFALDENDPDRRIDAARWVARLPAPDRFLLLLLHGEGWSVAEIAEKTGWSKSNVKVRAYRARRKLRELVERDARDSGSGGRA